MLKNSSRRLLEYICVELSGRSSFVLPDDEWGEDGELLEQIKNEFDITNSSAAINAALDEIAAHFKLKKSMPPFACERQVREFSRTDGDFIDFVAAAVNIRGVSQKSQQFEVLVAKRLEGILTGEIHRVGWPRTKKKTIKAYRGYLGSLGFKSAAVPAHTKDAGFDLIWLPPLGHIPIRPVVSIQCKNSSYDESDADASRGKAARTINNHKFCTAQHHHYTFFNDYIDEGHTDKSGLQFVPFGLTDLSKKLPLTQLFIL